MPEIDEFARFNHLSILHSILRSVSVTLKAASRCSLSNDSLLAIGMELPEDAFVKQHGFDTVGESYGALCIYCT